MWSSTVSVYKPVYKLTGLYQTSQIWSKVVISCQNCPFWRNWVFWWYWGCQLNHRQKLTCCVQNCSKLTKSVNFDTFGSNFIKIVNFDNFGWFSDIPHVNWILDKSWHVMFRIDQNWQKVSILTLLGQISLKSSILTNLSDLVTCHMSTESSTKVDGYMWKLIILVKSVKFSWFWSKMTKIDDFDILRKSRSLMNPNRNCQNWRFRQFWSISWKVGVLDISKVSKLTILRKSDNLHGDSLGFDDCQFWVKLRVVGQLIPGWYFNKMTILINLGHVAWWYIWFSSGWWHLKSGLSGCELSTTNSGYQMR